MRSKKWLLTLSLSLLLVLTLAGCGQQRDTSVKKIQDKKVLVVGTEADFAPFEFPVIKNGQKQITGYDIYIARRIAKKLGVKLEVQNTTFSSLITDLNQNKVDIVMAGMTDTPAREKSVAFSMGYYKVKNVLLVQKGQATTYAHISDLAGKSVGAQQASLQESIAKNHLTKSNLVTESNVNSLASELQNGKLSGVILDSVVADNFIKQHPDKYEVASVALPTPKSQRNISVATRKGDKKLLKQVNLVIKQMKQTGQLDKLYQQAQDEEFSK